MSNGDNNSIILTDEQLGLTSGYTSLTDEQLGLTSGSGFTTLTDEQLGLVDDETEYSVREIIPIKSLFMTAEEEEAKKGLEERYGHLNMFKFEEAVWGQDWIDVTVTRGKNKGKTTRIGFDYSKGSDEAEKQAEKLQNFIQDNIDWDELGTDAFIEKKDDEEYFRYKGFERTESEMFEFYKNEKLSGTARSLAGNYNKNYDRWDNLMFKRDYTDDKLTKDEEKELQKINKILDDFESWVLDLTKTKTWSGRKRSGIAPHTRAAKERAIEIAEMDEEDAVDSIRKDALGSSTEAFERGFMHDAIEVRHRNYNNGERTYIELQRVWGNRKDDVDQLYDLYLTANPNMGIYADHRKNRYQNLGIPQWDAKNRTYVQMGVDLDRDKVQELLEQTDSDGKQLYTLKEAQDMSLLAATTERKRQSITNALFIEKDEFAAKIRSSDKAVLKDSGWEVKRRTVGRRGGSYLDIYHNGVLVESYRDISTSATYDYGEWGKADQYAAYDKVAQYIYKNASDEEIELMYLNNQDQVSDVFKELREKKDSIVISDKDAANEYIDSGRALKRFKEELSVGNVSQETINIIEKYINATEHFVENRKEWMEKVTDVGPFGTAKNAAEQILGYDLTDEALSYIVGDQVREDKIRKFQNLGAIWDLIPLRDQEKVLEVLEKRKGYIDQNGDKVLSTIERGIEQEKLQLLDRKNLIWSEKIFEDLSPKEAELMRRYVDFQKADASQQATILQSYSDNTWKSLELQYRDKSQVLEKLIERAEDDGVGIVFTNNDITNGFEITTDNKELKEKYYDQLVKIQKSIKELNKTADQAELDISEKISVWQNNFEDIYQLDATANIDYSTWWEDFGNSWMNIGLSIPALFGSDSAMEAMQRLQNTKMKHGETRLSWQEAIETGQKAEFIGNTAAEQLPNIMLAFTPIGRIAGSILTKVASRAGSTFKVTKGMQRQLDLWSVPGVYGLTSMGNKRMEVEGRMDAALKAQEALTDLKTAYENGNISYDDFVENKMQLERTIAEGDIGTAQKWGSILTSGIIEGTITRYFGTAPNARKIMKSFYNPKTTDVAEALFRSNRRAVADGFGQFVWRTGGEIIEETSIEVGNVLADGLWLGDDLDWSQVDDVMVSSLIMGGGMNGLGAAYTTITSQMATSDFRKEGLSVIESLKRIEKQWENPNLSQNSRMELKAQYATVLDQFNGLKDGLEIDAMLVGADNIKTLMGLNTELSLIYDKANIKKGDSEGVIQQKLEQYKKTLDNTEANQFQDSIDNVNSAKERIYNSIDYNDKIGQLFGKPGEQLDARWKDKNNKSKKAVEYRNADAKGRLKMLLQQTRDNIKNNNIRKAKADGRLQEKIEEEVYSERDDKGNITRKMNFEQWKKFTGKKNRKTKLENDLWENAGNNMLARTVDAKLLFEEGDVNAKAVLGDKLASELQIKKAESKKDLEKIILESGLRDDQKNEYLASLASGKANGVIIGNQYIVLNEETARKKLDNGDIMQGTVLMHEISHFLDDMAFTKQETIDYSTKLYNYLSKNKKLNHINLVAQRNLIETGIWKGGEEATFEQQDYTTKDEYVREVQSLLQARHNKGTYDSIKKDVGQSLMNKLRGLVNADYKIKTDQDAMYYMVAFLENFSNGKGISKVAKRKIKAAKKTDKKVTAKEAKETIKKSTAKKASEKVQRIYEEKGVEGSLEIIEQYTPMVNKLVNKYKDVPGFDRELLIDEITTGKRGILDLIMDYNPKSGVPLAAYINKYLSSRAIEAANRVLKTQFEVDIDTGRGIAEQIEETTEVYSESISTEQKQNLRKKLNITKGSDIYNKVVESVVLTFGTKLPDVNSKKFKQELTKSFRTELKKAIADLMGTRAKYEQFLKDNWQTIYESIPQSTMNKRFKDFIQPVLDKDGKQLREKTPQGNAIFEKKKINQGEFLNYFLSKNVGASTRGTRKDALAEELGVELGFDATMEVVQSPEVQEKRNQILSLLNQEQYDNEVAIIAKQIDRDPTIKFSSSSADAQFADLANLVKKQGYSNVFNKEGVINNKYKNRFNEKVLDNFSKLFDENKLLSIDSELIRKRAEDLFGTGKFKDTGLALERAINDYVDSLNIPGLVVLNRETSEKGGLADLVLGINIGGESFIETNVEIKLSATQVFMSNRLVTNYNIKTGKFTYTDDIKSLRQGEMLNKTRPAIKAFYARANELIREHNKTTLFVKIPEMEMATDYMPEYIYDKLIEEGLWNAIRKESLKHGEHNESLVVEMYGKKKYSTGYIELLGKGLYALGRDIMFNGKVPSLKAIIDVGIHMAKYSEAKKKDGTRTKEQEYGVKMVQAKPRFQPKIRQGQQIDNSPVSLSNKKSLQGIMSNYSILNETIVNDNNRKTKERNAINNSRQTSKYSKSRGMSTFDFDETLIIEGENFITATHPDTKETVKISSANWPKIGPRLSNEGYEFDFSDFVNVRGGVEGPLLQKMKNQINKFGPNNMFVLTARPKESADAIHGWLKSQGIDIPLENITGLGNSTGEAKAEWMLDKFAEGYNDMYFVDDALSNVDAVKSVLDQLDIKSDVQQARIKYSQSINDQFQDLLEEATGIRKEEKVSEKVAELRGKRKGFFKYIIPPSAQDFMGLMYNFVAKGEKGEKQMAFLKKALIDPFARSVRELNKIKQSAGNDYRNLLKKFPKIKKRLKKKAGDTDFTIDQAVRVYLWNKAGFDIPGLSESDINTLVDFIKGDSELQAFADGLGLISKRKDGYAKPGEYWTTENIISDLMSDGTIGDVRSEIFAEWIENKNIIFSKENLNKIEAAYGKNFREALEDVLYRMEHGTNRPTGRNRLVNMYMNWVNNSVGAIMFFNMRSALLQTISTFNYINLSDNNILKAAAAFGNQKQFWSDFVTIFNSDMLKQRRAGNQRSVNESELMAAVAGSSNPAKAAIAWLLNKGFLPTQIADSFAISAGGATFYRNRIKSLMKQGMSKKEAENQAFLDFQETTEVSQQSSRPDLISQQQASPLGRLILAFANTPMQYARIMNKSVRDIMAGRGDTKTHISKIIYYGVAQSFIFTALQQALWAAIGSEEDEDEMETRYERLLNGMIDNLLVGIGFGGRAISSVKNSILEYQKQRSKDFGTDHTYTMLQLLGFSPPISSKLRKIYSAIQTERFNRDVIGERGFTLDNPAWSIVGNVTEAVTNIPLGRLHKKLTNLEQALDSNNEWWKRVALVLGWNTWDLDIKDQDIEELKINIKERKKKDKKKESKKKEKKKIEDKNKDLEKANIEKQRKEIRENNYSDKGIKCAAISKSGSRCKKDIEPGESYCTIHAKVEQRKDGEKKQCTKIKSDGKRCKMKTSSKSGLCYYHD